MATEIQRVQSICDGLMNQVATAAQINRLSTALATQAGRLAEYQAATATGKARIFLDAMRAFGINTIKSTEASSAAQAAADTAAASAANSLPEVP